MSIFNFKGRFSRVIIFSDLHLADSLYLPDSKGHNYLLEIGYRDDFHPYLIPFIDTYNKLVRPTDLVVFAGDFLELNQCSPLEIKGAYSWLIDYILSKPSYTIFCPGNHDPYSLLDKTISSTVGIKYQNYKVVEQNKIIIHEHNLGIMHGDTIDPIISKNRQLAWAIGKLGGMIEKVRPDVDIWFSNTITKLKKLGRHANTNAYIPHLLSFADHYNLTSIVYGHTHNTSIVRLNDITLANTGCWVKESELGAVISDIDDGIQLKRVVTNSTCEQVTIISS